MISESEAVALVGMLVGSTTGWNDDAADATVTLIEQRWNDYDAAMDAILSVVESWTRPSRPPWGVLSEAYRSEARRRALDTPAISPGQAGLIPTLAEGRAIAMRAYVAECESRPADDPLVLSGFRSRRANQYVLDVWLGLTEPDDDE